MDYYKNIYKLYVIVFFHNLIPAYVIERLFWEQRGMTVLMVVFCEMIYAVTIVIAEIPTGIFADKFGRKTLLVVAGFLSMLELIILLFAHHFWAFGAAVFLAGIARACSSGASNALLYDSLLVEKKEASFEKIIGRINSLDFIAAMLAALSGGVLAKLFGFEFNYILSIASMVAALGFTVFLKEPPRIAHHTNALDKSSGIKDYLIHSAAFFKKNPRLVLIITHATAIAACINYLDEFWQLYLNEIGFSVLFFGLFSAIISLARIPGNLLAARLLNHFKHETIILSVLGTSAAGFCITAIFSGMAGIFMIIFIFLASGVVEPVVAGYLHHRGSSDIRATIESFQSLIEKGITFIVGVGFGVISTHTSIVVGFGFLGAVMCLLFLLFAKKNSGHLLR